MAKIETFTKNGELKTVGGATKQLDNLSNVAVNVDIVSDTDSTDSLGSSAIKWLMGWFDRLTLGEGAAPSTPAAGDGVIYVKSADSLLYFKNDGGTEYDLTAGGGGGGEANTGSNVGTAGVGVFDGKVGVDLQFKNVAPGSSKLSVTDDAANNEIDLDVVEANLTHDNIGGILGVAKGGTGANLSATGPGVLRQLTNGAVVDNMKYNFTATGAPTTTDDSASGYDEGSLWIDLTNDKAYICLDATATAAVWTEITQAGGGGAVGDLDDYQVYASTQVVNTTSKTAVVTHTVAADALGTNDAVFFEVWFEAGQNDGGGRTATLDIEFGATAILTEATTVLQNASNRTLFHARGVIQNDGSASGQFARVWHGEAGAAVAANTLQGYANDREMWDTLAEDTTAAKNLVISITLSHASAGFFVDSVGSNVILLAP